METNTVRSSVVIGFACATNGFFFISYVLANKYILEHFRLVFSFTLYQNLVVVVLFFICSKNSYFRTKIETFPPLSYDIVRKWLILELIFVCLIVTSAVALTYVSVATYVVFKALITIPTAILDRIRFGYQITPVIWFAFLLFSISTVLYGYNDLTFSVVGYIVMIANKILMVLYPIAAKSVQVSTGLGDLFMVYITNLLSIPLLLYCVLGAGEQFSVRTTVSQMSSGPLAAFLLSGLLALGINASSFIVIRVSSPTTYSIISTICNIPSLLLGVWWFKTKVNLGGKISILLCLLATILYVGEKLRLRRLQTARGGLVTQRAEAYAKLQTQDQEQPLTEVPLNATARIAT